MSDEDDETKERERKKERENVNVCGVRPKKVHLFERRLNFEFVVEIFELFLVHMLVLDITALSD